MKVTLNLSGEALYVTLVALEDYKANYNGKAKHKWTNAAYEAYEAIRTFTETFFCCCGQCKHFRQDEAFIGNRPYCNTRRIVVEPYKNDCNEYEEQ